MPQRTTLSVTFTITGTVAAGVTRAVTFDFECLAPIVGLAEIEKELPLSIYESEDLSLRVELTNVPWLTHPYDTLLFLCSLSNNGVPLRTATPVSSISLSSREEARVRIDVNSFFAVGSLQVEMWAVDSDGSDRVFVIVVADPDPVVIDHDPRGGESDRNHTARLTVEHLPVDTVMLSVKMVGETGAETTMTVVEFKFISDEVVTPLVNPDGENTGSMGSIVISGVGFEVSAPFVYEPAGTPELELVDPRMTVLEAADDQAIQIFTRSVECNEVNSCAAEADAVGVSVTFDRFAGTIVNKVDQSGLMVLSVAPPTQDKQDKGAEVTVSISTSANADVMTFLFPFDMPDASVVLIDGSMVGGSMVTVTAHGWGADVLTLTNPSTINVAINGVECMVESITPEFNQGRHSKLEAVVYVPASRVSVFVLGSITVADDADLSADFDFIHFPRQTVVAISNTATTAGETVSAAGTMVANFPPVKSAQDVEVSFGNDAPCNGFACGVIGVANSVDRAELTIKVPTSTTVGAKDICIEFVGTEAAPPGEDPTGVYVREEKVDVAVFSFDVPASKVQSVLVCLVCSSDDKDLPCLAAGCEKRLAPLVSTAPMEKAAKKRDRIATICIKDMPRVDFKEKNGNLDGSCKVSTTFGLLATGKLKMILQSDDEVSAMEVEVLEVSRPLTVDAEVSMASDKYSPMKSADFKFTSYDCETQLLCGDCAAPTVFADPFPITMTNFPLRTDIPALDQVEVEYGKTNAQSETIVSTNRSQAVLLIEPPAIGCEKCKDKVGYDDIKLKVTSVADKKIKAEENFILWAAPQIDEAVVDKSGAAIEFASETNGESFISGDCTDILDYIPELGDQPFYVFKTPSFLQVYLGEHATVLPDSILGVKELAIYSKSLISRASASKTVVKKPIKPVFSISTPSSIDLCVSLRVDAVAISTRPMTWEWMCKNDKDFDQHLETAGFGSLLVLDALTPQMSKTDLTYKINVRVTDFLGTKSKKTVVEITKKSTPDPQVFFSPPAIMSVSPCTSSSFPWHLDPSPNTNEVTELAGLVVGLNLLEKESGRVETWAIGQSNLLNEASNVITVTNVVLVGVGGDAMAISGLSGAVASGSMCTLGSVMVMLFENNTFTSSIGSTTVPDLGSNGVRVLRHASFSSKSPQIILAAKILLGIVFAARVISWSVVSRGKEAWRGCCCTRKTPAKRPRYSSLLALVTALVLCAAVGALTRSELAGLISSCTSGSSTACTAVEEADTSTITDMSELFRSSSFTGDLSGWNVTSVENMNSMFWLSAFTGDLSQWDVSSVTDMGYMFYTSEFNGNIGAWDVSRVQGMSGMFYSSSFSGDISNWDVSAVNDTSSMFSRSSFTGDLSRWNVSSVTDMGYMFSSESFNGNIANWDVSAVKSMWGMFDSSTFNGDLGQWDVSSVTTMRSMFNSCPFTGDIGQWNVSKVTDMSFMFSVSAFNGNISVWDTSSVTTMAFMFRESAFTGDLSKWDVSKVETMSDMFRSSDFRGNIGRWDVSKVTDMSDMFYRSEFNGNIANWDVSKVETMYRMFQESTFTGDLSRWDTSKVETMHVMFRGSPFNGNIGDWDVSKVETMSSMFRDSTFNADISRWDTSSVTTMHQMFYASAFAGDLCPWDLANRQSVNQGSMFSGSPLAEVPHGCRPSCQDGTQNNNEIRADCGGDYSCQGGCFCGVSDNCDADDATCTNTDSSFTCSCNSGFSGDGTSCWACWGCPAGEYPEGCSGSSAGVCTPCPADAYKTGSGSEGCTTCGSCGAGQYREGCGASTAGTCESCPRNTFKATSGGGACTACEACDAGLFRSGCGGLSPGTCEHSVTSFASPSPTPEPTSTTILSQIQPPAMTAGGAASSTTAFSMGNTTNTTTTNTTTMTVMTMMMTTSETEPAPAELKLQVSTTLEGMTAAQFDDSAQETFKSEVASLLPGKTAADVDITGIEEVSGRRLLAAGLKVDYEVAGFASEEEIKAAARGIEEKREELVVNLQADNKFISLTGISNDFPGDVIIPPTSTPIGSATPGRVLSKALVLLASGSVFVVQCLPR